MRKKFIKIMAIALVLVAPVVLSGCQTKCPKASSNVPGTDGYRADCPYEEPASDASNLKEINFYYLFDNTDAYRAQIQAFQSQNPGVVIRPKKFVNVDEYKKLVIGEIADGEGPDVFMVHNTWMPEFKRKLLPMPLDLPVAMNAPMFRQTYFQAAADDLLIDEQIYGMPLSVDSLAIYYNKQIFKDLLATTDSPGSLWEDVREQVFKLTKKDNSPERFSLAGIAMGRADNLLSPVDTLLALMLQYGVKFYDDKEESATFANDTGAGSGGLKNPGVEALTFFTSFALPSYKNYSWNETITGFSPADKEVNPFVRGKVAMIVGYPYLYNEIVRQIEIQQRKGDKHINVDDIGVAPFPQLVDPNISGRRDALASYFPLVVARTSDVPKEAWSFVQYLTSADALQTYHKETNKPTSRKDMVQNQQTEPEFGVYAFQAPFAKTVKIFDDAAYQKVFRDAIQEVIRNTATAKQALTTAQTKITCLIRKQKDLESSDTDCGI